MDGSLMFSNWKALSMVKDWHYEPTIRLIIADVRLQRD
jgi:hypothetical protein